MNELQRGDHFAQFVAGFDALLSKADGEAEILENGAHLLRTLVADDNWLPDDFAQPDPDRYTQYLLYLDPHDRFSVVSFVWGPGQKTPVHDHTVWGLVGVLRGAELSQRFRFDNGELISINVAERLEPGRTEAVSPRVGDIHQVSNAFADQVSISIHVYGADIGKVKRNIYTAEGGVRPFVSGYSNPGGPVLLSPVSLTDAQDLTPAAVRNDLMARREIAILDLREEGPYALGHPLFAASLPLSRLETDVLDRLPNKNVKIVVYDDGEGLVDAAVPRLVGLGYDRVHVLKDGLKGWQAAGYESFQDVNSASKAFGELVESSRHTPSLSAPEAKDLIEQDPNVVVLDARRFEEFHTMSIPRGISVPGAELVLRARAIAPDPATTIIVNCAGRTRSIVGAQSLINAGVPNRVVALRNGTIGWTLAGQALDRGQTRRFSEPSPPVEADARAAARAVAYRAGVKQINLDELANLLADQSRTVYRFDVRTPEEYEAGHVDGFRSAPGGQLVQETDVFAPVRGARIVLRDSRSVRADMTASWLAQMGWEVYVLAEAEAAVYVKGTWKPAVPPLPTVQRITAGDLIVLQQRGDVVVIDLASSPAYRVGHISGAWFAIRSRLREALRILPGVKTLVLTSPDGVLAQFASAKLAAQSGREVYALAGGTSAWIASGGAIESGFSRSANEPDDVYRRPYEGTNNPASAMQAYLDWEYGLVAQLERDGTHGFYVI